MFRHCRKQQAKFDKCVLDELGWVRPDLGELSKVRHPLDWVEGIGCDKGRRGPSEDGEAVSGPDLPDKGLDIQKPVCPSRC